jgi:hypothetical protein
MNDDATRDREVQIFMEQEDFQYIWNLELFSFVAVRIDSPAYSR